MGSIIFYKKNIYIYIYIFKHCNGRFWGYNNSNFGFVQNWGYSLGLSWENGHHGNFRWVYHFTSVWGLAKVYKVVVYKPFDYTYLCIYHKPMKTLALVISCYWSDYNPTSPCLAPPG